jgi:hypothetical protein
MGRLIAGISNAFHQAVDFCEEKVEVAKDTVSTAVTEIASNAVSGGKNLLEAAQCAVMNDFEGAGKNLAEAADDATDVGLEVLMLSPTLMVADKLSDGKVRDGLEKGYDVVDNATAAAINSVADSAEGLKDGIEGTVTSAIKGDFKGMGLNMLQATMCAVNLTPTSMAIGAAGAALGSVVSDVIPGKTGDVMGSVAGNLVGASRNPVDLVLGVGAGLHEAGVLDKVLPDLPPALGTALEAGMTASDLASLGKRGGGSARGDDGAGPQSNGQNGSSADSPIASAGPGAETSTSDPFQDALGPVPEQRAPTPLSSTPGGSGGWASRSIDSSPAEGDGVNNEAQGQETGLGGEKSEPPKNEGSGSATVSPGAPAQANAAAAPSELANQESEMSTIKGVTNAPASSIQAGPTSQNPSANISDQRGQSSHIGFVALGRIPQTPSSVPPPSRSSTTDNPMVGPHNALSRAPRRLDITGADAGQQPALGPSTAVTLMTSGGVRKTESGNTVSFFVRETPDSLSAEDWMAMKGPVDASKPYRQPRSTVPDDLMTPMSFKNIKEFMQSDFAKNQTKQAIPEVSVPGLLQRTGDLMRAKREGMAPNGWKYDQKQAPDGSYSISASRLYATVAPKKISGTQLTVPTREIELYEVNRKDHHGAGQAIPKEVREIGVFLPESGATSPVNQAGNVKLKATVNCHELGNKYLLYRAEKPNSGEVSDSKRQLVINAHGSNQFMGRAKLTEGVKLSFYSPDGAMLLSAPSLALTPLDAKYSTHELEPASLNSNSPFSYVTTKEGTQIDGDGAYGGAVSDLAFYKFGSPVHDAASKAARFPRVMNHSAEGAAWAAHDHDVDVLTVRQGSKFTGGSSLSAVTAQLEKLGLTSQYDEIKIVACRSGGLKSGIHHIANNL